MLAASPVVVEPRPPRPEPPAAYTPEGAWALGAAFLRWWEYGLHLPRTEAQRRRDPNPTHWGITLRTLQGRGRLGDLDGDGDVDVEDILRLTWADAAAIYRAVYYVGPNAHLLAPVSPRLAVVLLDSCVQHGVATGTALLQRAARALPDGRLGSKTLAAVRGRVAQLGDDAFVAVVLEHRAAHYQRILARRPDLAANRNGWRNRYADLCRVLAAPCFWPAAPLTH